MNEIQILAKQTADAYGWANKVLDTIPYAKWDITPEVIQSNITWQAGHLIISFYYHSIMVIAGHQMEILQKVPMKVYSDLFTNASPAAAVGKADPEALHNHLRYLQQKSMEMIGTLSPGDLERNLVPTPMAHPIAKKKGEALTWNIHHTLWHCGQIGLLKRVIDSRFDFGLQ